MKPLNLFLLVIGIVALIVGVAWYVYPGRQPEPMQRYSGTIQKDCAPWDGPAFTLSLPRDDGTAISVSIWQSPEDISFPATFEFPDTSGQVGNASLMHAEGMPEELSGNVRFQQVTAGQPVVGEFHLTLPNNEKLEGTFQAEWVETNFLCG